MTKEKFLYGLNSCAVTYHNGQRFYEHDELVKCFEDLGIFEQEPVLDKIRAEIKNLHYHPKLDFIKTDEVIEMTLNIIDKYKAESEDRK